MVSFKSKNRQIFIILLFFFLVSLLTGFFLFNKDNIFKLGSHDWDQHYVYAEINRTSLLDYHQVPLWNPYHCGGLSQIGNPQNDFFSPLSWLTTIFGPVVGYKVEFLVYLFFGLLGCYYLGQYFKISKLGSTVLSFIYIFSGTLIAFGVGMTNFLNIMLLPSLCFFYFKALDQYKIKYMVFSAIMITLMFFGGYHYFFQIILFISILSLINFIFNRNKKSIIVFLSVLLIFLSLSAVKLIPAVGVLTRSSRVIEEDVSGYSLKSLYMSLFSKEQNYIAFDNWGKVGSHSFLDGLSYELDENGMYVGFISLILFLLGIFYKIKKHWSLIIVFIFFLLLSFGFNINPSLYKFLSNFPVFNSMGVAQRYRFFFMIPFVIFVGFGLDFINNLLTTILKNKKLSTVIVILLGLITVFKVVSVNLAFLADSFDISPVYISKVKSFSQRCRRTYDNTNPNKNEFGYLKAGDGSPACYEPIRISSEVKCPQDLGYKGEYFLEKNNGKVSLSYWSPNKIVLNLAMEEKDRLVVNQNFDPGWKVNFEDKHSLSAEDFQGLLSINVSKYTKKVTFFYFPYEFIIGTIITLTSIIMLVLFFLISKNGEKYSHLKTKSNKK